MAQTRLSQAETWSQVGGRYCGAPCFQYINVNSDEILRDLSIRHEILRDSNIHCIKHEYFWCNVEKLPVCVLMAPRGGRPQEAWELHLKTISTNYFRGYFYEFLIYLSIKLCRKTRRSILGSDGMTKSDFSLSTLCECFLSVL